MQNQEPSFEWDENKNQINQLKHGVSFEFAQNAFDDPHRVIIRDLEHGEQEERFFCLGQIKDSILTVRFCYRDEKIRIFGAGFWRQGKKRYEKENNLHR